MPPLAGLGADPAYSYTLVGTGIYQAKRSSDKKRKKRRAIRAHFAAIEEAERRRHLSKFRLVLSRLTASKRTATQELRRAKASVEAAEAYASQMDDEDEAEAILKETAVLGTAVSEGRTILGEYEVFPVKGSEPAEFLVDAIKEGERAQERVTKAHRIVRKVWRRAEWVARNAHDIVKREQEAARLAVAQAKAEEARKRSAVRSAARKQRSTAWDASTLEWEQSMQLRRERVAMLREKFRSGIMQGTSGLGDLGGFFDELFGTAKKKDKRREKKRRIQAQVDAEREKKDRADQRSTRRKAQISDVFRAVRTEASDASGWAKRIHRALSESPDLSASFVQQSMVSVGRWEAGIQTVLSGVGQLDLGIDDPYAQDAILAELQAALGAMRTIRMQATRLKKKVDVAVADGQAKSARLSNLLKEQQALAVREKTAKSRLMAAQADQGRVDAQKRRVSLLRTRARAGSRLAAERASLAIAIQRLRDEERRRAMMSAFRAGRSVLPLMRPGAFSGLRGAF